MSSKAVDSQVVTVGDEGGLLTKAVYYYITGLLTKAVYYSYYSNHGLVTIATIYYRWDQGSCTHTNGGSEWWEVDLGREYQIDHVKIFGRNDHHQDRLEGSRVGFLRLLSIFIRILMQNVTVLFFECNPE